MAGVMCKYKTTMTNYYSRTIFKYILLIEGIIIIPVTIYLSLYYFETTFSKILMILNGLVIFNATTYSTYKTWNTPVYTLSDDGVLKYTPINAQINLNQITHAELYNRALCVYIGDKLTLLGFPGLNKEQKNEIINLIFDKLSHNNQFNLDSGADAPSPVN